MTRQPSTLDGARAALAGVLADPQAAWLAAAEQRVAADPAALEVVFPGVGRRAGRGQLDASAAPDDVHAWTIDDAARVLLVGAAMPSVDLKSLYRGGDAAERRAVLRAIGVVPGVETAAAMWLIDDAVRTNDPRLIAAALGPWTIRELADEPLAQAVLKCAFVGIPVDGLHGLGARATPELSRMLAAFAHERVAAGRDVPSDIWPLVAAHPPHEQLALIESELTHPTTQRADAATRALAAYRAATVQPTPEQA